MFLKIMTQAELVEQIKLKKSMLCVGLDTDITKIPTHLLQKSNPILEFNQKIIEATHQYAVAYKINTAFYEQYGSKGWDIMEKTLELIPKSCFTIADAKRGDIGNTSGMYAKAFFETLNFDAITVAPYMGYDSISPFLEYQHKTTIILGLTSNIGNKDFQLQKTEEQNYFYEMVLDTASKWGDTKQIMFVIGATNSSMFQSIRQQLPDHFFLVPGIGAQGGDLQTVMQLGQNKNGGMLINSSRGIIYINNQENFETYVMQEAHQVQQSMAALMHF